MGLAKKAKFGSSICRVSDIGMLFHWTGVVNHSEEPLDLAAYRSEAGSMHADVSRFAQNESPKQH